MSQRAMIGARASDSFDQQAKERQKASGGDKKSGEAKSVVDNWPQPTEERGKARDKAGEVVGISGRTIDRATRRQPIGAFLLTGSLYNRGIVEAWGFRDGPPFLPRARM